MTQTKKTMLATGGARGIGLAIARRFVADGWNVAIADTDAERGPAAADQLSEIGDAFFIQADVADEGDVERMNRAVSRRWGRLDALINNAAIAANKPLAALSLAEWERVLAVNLTGPWLCAKHAAPLLVAAGGSIVNIASTRAFQSEANTEAYSASKGGLVALTHALAISLGPDIRVNCISPGWIDTAEAPLTRADREQHPAGRVGAPEDIAAMAAWLAGPESGFVTGANFMIDGGMSRKMIYV